MRFTYQFSGGVLSVGEEFRREVERRAFLLGVQVKTQRSGWIERVYTMYFDGDADACLKMKLYINALARANRE